MTLPRRRMGATISLFYLIFSLCSGMIFAQNEDVLILKEDKDQEASPSTGLLYRPGEEGGPANRSFLLLYEKWRLFERAFLDGNTFEADKALREMVALRTHNSLPKVTELAVSLVQFGNIELSRKKPDEALNLYQAATALDPSMPNAFYSQSKIYLSRGIRGFSPAVQTAVRGFWAPHASLSGRILFYSKYVLISVSALIIVGFVFAAVLLIKYNRLLLHELVEKYGSKLNPVWLKLVIWILLFLPVLLFLGFLWLAPFWLMIFWRYGRPVEKLFATGLLIVFALAYPLYLRAKQISLAFKDPFVSSYLTAFSEGASLKSIENFENYLKENPKDRDGSILLAYLYKNNQQIQKAIETLQKHILDYSMDARAYNNLAHIFFLQEEADTALTLCQKALRLDERNPLYLYNVSRLQRAKFNFEEAQKLMEDARVLNPGLIEILEQLPQMQLIDDIPDDNLVWQRFQKKNGPFLNGLANPFSVVAIGLIFLTFVFHIGAGRSKSFARQCTKCGKPFCKKCQASVREHSFCTQCLHIFLKRDGVSPGSRVEKMEEIEKYSQRRNLLSRLSSLLLPGSGNLYQNQTLLGTFILVFWFFFLCLLFFNFKFADLSYLEPPQNNNVLTTLSILVLAFLYLLSNLLFFRKSTI